MAIDLKTHIRDWAIGTLPYDRSDSSLVAEINSKSARDLLIVYHNWMSRHVFAIPRRVHISAAYRANPISTTRKADLEVLIGKIQGGQELKPHLSTRVDTVLESASKKLNRRRDLDLMLIEWDVHHLHISQTVRPDGFVERGDPLLFAVFRGANAYLLDVMTHKDFNRDHILEVMAQQFPGKNLVHELSVGKGLKIVGLAKNYTEDERNMLRNVGINTLVEIRGKIYKPAGGMTTAGTSIRSSIAADRVISATEKLEDLLGDRAPFERLAQKHGVNWPADPSFEFGLLEPSGLAFKELSTNLVFDVA